MPGRLVGSAQVLDIDQIRLASLSGCANFCAVWIIRIAATSNTTPAIGLYTVPGKWLVPCRRSGCSPLRVHHRYDLDVSRHEHWENIYATKGDAELSWTQFNPHRSLSLIRRVCPLGRVIDVGGGASILCDRLLDAGYTVDVLDISATALARARARLGPRAEKIRWIVADVTTNADVGTHDVWHDRAVFHFLTESADRAAYVALLRRSVSVGGQADFATFAPDGP